MAIVPKKVLIINIFGIGDVLFTTPIISSLKKEYAEVNIDYLCNRRAAEVVESNPHVNKVFIYERDAFNAYYKKSKLLFLKNLKHFLTEIKKENYDLVIDVSLNTFTSFIAWLSGAKHRLGYNYKNRNFLLNKRIDLEGYSDKHVVEYYLELLNKFGISPAVKELNLNIKSEENQWASDFFHKNGIKETGFNVSLIPGGGSSWGKDAHFKRWSAEKYAKLADKIIEKFSANIILISDKNEKDLCESIAQLMQNRAKLSCSCGEANINQFAALAKKSSLVILNDGGPLHICVAAKANTISIFGPVDSTVYGPYPSDGHSVVTSQVPCRPCYRKFRRAQCAHLSCLNQITVEDVLRKVEEFYERTIH